jgi:ABC-2 type transport system permease protein
VLPDPGYLFYVEKLAVGAIPSLLILVLGLYVYHRMSADFAEEL